MAYFVLEFLSRAVGEVLDFLWQVITNVESCLLRLLRGLQSNAVVGL